MAIAKNLTQEQKTALAEFFDGRESLPEPETLKFLAENNLPWDNVPAFRLWSKENGYLEGGTKTSSGSRGNSPTVRGINKFGGATDAMNLAQILLQDKEKAISGAITQLEEEINEIQLEGEQQISIIKAAVEEQVESRKNTIDLLRNELPGR